MELIELEKKYREENKPFNRVTRLKEELNKRGIDKIDGILFSLMIYLMFYQAYLKTKE